jgi:hypothetical protein
MSVPAFDRPAFVARETVATVTPLGIRFRDSATERVVTDGLVVRHSFAQDTRSRTAVVNPSGVWVLSGLPGLHDLETGLDPAVQASGAEPGDAVYWGIVAGLTRSFAIDVLDARGRFLPLRLDAQAPFRGLFEPTCGSPASPAGAGADVPLFSTAARPAPPGFGMVRAQLLDVSGAPAAWAVLEVTPDGAPPALGMADERGLVALPVPYPGPSATAGSPPRGSTRPLSAERWAVRVRCFYDRSCPPDGAPDLCRALGQGPATLDLAPSPPGAALELGYGRDLLLRTPGRWEVVVTPAASPP